MSVLELISNNKDKVRRDSNLMHFYLKHFKETFGYTPNCAGCSFSTDWNKLVSFYSKKVKNDFKNEIYMDKIKIKKAEGKILSYKKEGKTYRLYDNILTQPFINDYLTFGTKEEIENRKKMFRFPEMNNNQEFADKEPVVKIKKAKSKNQ